MRTSSISKRKNISLLESFQLSIDKMNFTFEKQIEFIDLLESFKGLNAQMRLAKLKEAYEGNRKRKTIETKVCDDLSKHLTRGCYDRGLEKWFSKKILFNYRVASYLSDKEEIGNTLTRDIKLEGELVYKYFIIDLLMPLVVFLVALIGIALLQQVAFPLFAKLLNIKDIISKTPESITVIGEFVFNYGLYALALLIIIISFYFYLRNNWVGFTRDRYSSQFPFLCYRSFQCAKLLKAIATMKGGNMNLLAVLEQLKYWVNPYLQWHVKKMIKGTSRGRSKADFFGIGLLSEVQLIRLRALQEYSANNYSEALMMLATTVEKDAITTLKKQSKWVCYSIYTLAAIFMLVFLEGFAALTFLIDM